MSLGCPSTPRHRRKVKHTLGFGCRHDMLQHILGEAEVARRQVLREVLRLLHLAAGSSRHLWVLAKPWFVSELLLASRFEFSFAFCSFAEGSCPFCVCFVGGGESFHLCTCQAGCQQDVLWESATALAYSLTKVGQRDPALACFFAHTLRKPWRRPCLGAILLVSFSQPLSSLHSSPHL